MNNNTFLDACKELKETYKEGTKSDRLQLIITALGVTFMIAIPMLFLIIAIITSIEVSI